MRFRYSPEVDILMVYMSEEPIQYGEDNEGLIVYHTEKGTPVALEVLDASKFVMLANTSIVSGQEIANPDVSPVPYTKERDVAIRAIPKGDADLRFTYLADNDTLIVKLGDSPSELCRRNHGMSVHYDISELPTGLEIENAQQFVLGSIKSVLLKEEVSVA